MKLKLALLAASIALSCVATAQPSVYYFWKHKVSGKTACEPEALDANWVKVRGPYQDANCSIPQPQ